MNANILLTYTNNDLINLKTIITVVLAAIGIGLVLYYYHKQLGKALGAFGAILVIWWGDIKDKFGG